MLEEKLKEAIIGELMTGGQPAAIAEGSRLRRADRQRQDRSG
ncbi:hypothetical protein ABIF26_005452 [Bradyrhizobium elkanii]